MLAKAVFQTWTPGDFGKLGPDIFPEINVHVQYERTQQEIVGVRRIYAETKTFPQHPGEGWRPRRAPTRLPWLLWRFFFFMGSPETLRKMSGTTFAAIYVLAFSPSGKVTALRGQSNSVCGCNPPVLWWRTQKFRRQILAPKSYSGISSFYRCQFLKTPDSQTTKEGASKC